MNYKKTSLAVIATAIAVGLVSPAFAQDVIGATPVVTAFIYVLKAIALGGIAWGFIMLMSGRHSIGGLVSMAVGALGIAKAQAIASLFGL